MIQGHGDDIQQYPQLRCNFSSNISPLSDTKPLRDFLATRLEVIEHYPHPSAHPLECLLAKQHGVKASEVLVTSGATDAIYLIAQTLRAEGTFAVKRPTFSEYADACRTFGYQEAPNGAAVRWLCNPNNPTGEVEPWKSVQQIAQQHHWLVIDLSYEDYTREKMPPAKKYLNLGNVITIHSMTKRYAIPGLRLGYIIAPETVINRLRDNYRPWAVNALAIEAGQWLLEQKDDGYEKKRRRFWLEADDMSLKLNAIWGVRAYFTTTNFMLCSIRQAPAAALKTYLLENHGFLIRDASNFEGLTPNHFRIAVQEAEYNNELFLAIHQFTKLYPQALAFAKDQPHD